MATEKTISFNRGVPSVNSFPTVQIKECVEAILSADAYTVLQYGKPLGYLPLREHIAGWYGVSADGILISNGSLQILEFLSTIFLEPGDTVFVERPTYDRTIVSFRRHAANVVSIPVRGDGPDVEVLAERLHAVVPKFFYTIPDFQNPTGVTASLAKRQEIVRLAAEYDFWILEDAPYRPLRYRGTEVASMRSLSPDRVMHLSSFTKLLSPGLRVGYVVAAADVIQAIGSIAANTYVCPGLLAEGVVYEFCRRGWLKPNIERLKQLYRPKLDATLGALQEHLPDARWTEPEGGYFVGVTLPEGTSIGALLEKATAVGLILSDGRGFFAEGGGDKFLRLAFPALSVQEIHEGISRLAELVAGS
ncbi:MAG: PLP-dependent aminotransferase family protein [Anaerolineales bacterium]|nr:MAG: PLP-dependent aminotransferase family protein [Anaerolineales bacterium]